MLDIILSGFFQIPLDNSNSLFDSQSWSLAIITWCSNWCLSMFVWFVSFRYPPHGRRAAAVENGVTWDRLRAPPIDTSPHDLHISDCLNELRPGDHIEIQWRRNKEFPYGLLLNFILPFFLSFWYLYSCFKSLSGCWLGAYLTYSFLFIIFFEFFNYFFMVFNLDRRVGGTSLVWCETSWKNGCHIQKGLYHHIEFPTPFF